MEDSEILKILEAAQTDSKWVSSNFDQLREKYENRIFAVKDRKVVGDADTVQDLLTELREKGENTALLLIESIPPKEISFIL